MSRILTINNNIKNRNRLRFVNKYNNIKGSILEALKNRILYEKMEDTTCDVETEPEEEIPMKHILKINDEINDETFDAALDLILNCICTGSTGDIVLIIDSPGGDVAAMFSIIDLLNSVPNKVITINMGMAGSCASNLFVLGDKRYMTKHAKFFFHSPAFLANEALLNLKALKDDIKTLEDICAHFENSLTSRTSIPKDLIKEGIATSDGIVLNSDECIKYKVTDEILTDFNKIITEKT